MLKFYFKRFVSLSRSDAGFNLIFLKTGLKSFKPAHLQGHRADGLLIAFVVDDIDSEYDRLQSEGVTITTPIETEPWGERFFQVTDPNGVVLQFKIQGIRVPDGFCVTAVVGVENATKLIKDGQRIRVYGTEGYVEIL